MAKTIYFYNIEREIAVPVENCTGIPTIVQITYKSPGEAKTPSTSVEVPLPGMPLSGTAFTSTPPTQPAKLRMGGKLSNLTVVSTGVIAAPQYQSEPALPDAGRLEHQPTVLCQGSLHCLIHGQP